MLVKVDKNEEKKGRYLFDLRFSFDESTGILSIECENSDFKNQKVKFDVNGKKYDADLDTNGRGGLEFEKSTPSARYVVKVDDKKTLTNGQKFLFFY